ncbi:FAD-binding protein, partial [bacterium]|nr:FAD-binding protein [bacterium]
MRPRRLFADPTTDQTPKTIAVIGAGLGGLTVAYRLQQAGYNVDVYEARR